MESDDDEVVAFPSFSFSHEAPSPVAKYSNSVVVEKPLSSTRQKRKCIVRPPPSLFFLDTKEDKYLAICSPEDCSSDDLVDACQYSSVFPLGLLPIYSIKYYQNGTFRIAKTGNETQKRYFERSMEDFSGYIAYKILPNLFKKGVLLRDFVALDDISDHGMKEEYTSFLATRLRLEGKLKDDPLSIQLWIELIEAQELDLSLNRIQIVHKKISVCEKALRRVGVSDSLLLLYLNLHSRIISFEETMKIWEVILRAAKTKENPKYRIAFIEHLLTRSGFRYSVYYIVNLIMSYLKDLLKAGLGTSGSEDHAVDLCQYLIQVLVQTGYLEHAFIILLGLCNHTQVLSISSLKQEFMSHNTLKEAIAGCDTTQKNIISSLLLLTANDEDNFYRDLFSNESLKKLWSNLSNKSVQRLVKFGLSIVFEDDSLRNGKPWDIALDPHKGIPKVKMTMVPKHANIMFPLSIFGRLCDEMTDPVCFEMVIRVVSVYDSNYALSLVKNYLSLCPSAVSVWIFFCDLLCLQNQWSETEAHLVKILSSSLEMTVDQRMHMIYRLIQLKYSSISEDEVKSIFTRYCLGVSDTGPVQSLKLKKFLENSTDNPFFWNIYTNPSCILRSEENKWNIKHRILRQRAPIVTLADLQAYSAENSFSSTDCIMKALDLLRNKKITGTDFEQFCMSWAVRGCYISEYSVGLIGRTV